MTGSAQLRRAKPEDVLLGKVKFFTTGVVYTLCEGHSLYPTYRYNPLQDASRRYATYSRQIELEELEFWGDR